MKNKEKMLLISQNKELLNKLNDGNTDKEEKNNNENYLLNEEVKTLKEQLENQAHNLLTLTAMENQINILKIENENLKKKKQTENEEEKNELSMSDKYANSANLTHSLTSNINTIFLISKNNFRS